MKIITIKSFLINKSITFNKLLILFVFGFYLTSANAFEYFQPLPDKVPVPDTNPLSKEKIELGKKLFFDPRLTRDGTFSCNRCHNIFAGAEDGHSFSTGYQGEKTARSAPSLWNVGFKTVLYWDGRSKSLEQQTKDHILDKSITGFSNENNYINRILKIPGYQKEFDAAYGKSANISLTMVAKAIASFERTLTMPDSRFDRYIRGNKSLFNKREKEGMEQFRLQGCVGCHFGVNFSGPAPGPALKMGDGFYEIFPNYRGSKFEKRYNIMEDKGIYLLTNNPRDMYMWRVPSLRNIMITAPYFHNGSAHTIEEAIEVMGKTQYNFDLTTQQINDIAVFLKTLTGVKPTISSPVLPDTFGKSIFGPRK